MAVTEDPKAPGPLLSPQGQQPAQDMVAAAGLATVALVVAGWTWLTYVDQPLLEAHAFRQTQTALTSYWTIRDGLRLAYETPVAGWPWSIPFEFPLYQWIVAAIASVGLPLGVVGRSISFAFMVASLMPAAMIFRRLGLPPRVWLAFTTLFLSSPLYVFWGRTFMIETAATCLMLFALAYGLDVVTRAASWTTVALAFAWTTLALLQKAPTALTVLAMLGIAWLVFGLRKHDWRRAVGPPSWLKPSFAWGAPLGVAILWAAYADTIKAQNPLGMWLTSAHLLHWNLGTLSQRISTTLWIDVVLFRGLFLNAGAGLGGLVILAALHRRTWNRASWLVAAALVAYLLAPLSFTNLHIVHDYYQVASTVFLIAAVAVAVAGWFPSTRLGRRAWLAVLFAVMLANFYQFHRYELPRAQQVISTEHHRTLAIGQQIASSAPIGWPILVYGLGWSSEIAFYAQRKSFTVPDWLPQLTETLTNPEKFLDGMSPGAVVVCPSSNGPTREAVDHLLAARDRYVRVDTHGCSILLRRNVGAPRDAHATARTS